MELIIKKQIGKTSYPFSFSGSNLHECVMESQKLSFFDVYKCGLCESDHLVLGARVAGNENFEYTYIKCLNCKGELTFGQKKKDKDTFYLRRNDDKSLAWKEHQSSNSAKQDDSSNSDSDNDLPF